MSLSGLYAKFYIVSRKMKNTIISPEFKHNIRFPQELSDVENAIHNEISKNKTDQEIYPENTNVQIEILVLTSYPPRECGKATYSWDLIRSLKEKFSNSLALKVCALETGDEKHLYSTEVKYSLNTSIAADFEQLAITINNDNLIKIILIQHEFGFFARQEEAFLQLISKLTKPVVIVFHTVLPHPDEQLKSKVKQIAWVCRSIIVMTNTSADILMNDYGISHQKISVIAYGTHLVPHLSKNILKEKYGLSGRKVLITFGLHSSGKGIETTLDALPAIVKQCPNILFLVIGKTHPEVVKSEGEKYREMLEQKVERLELQYNVRFINKYLALPELLEYLQLTNIYLLTANDLSQAVSGTFAHAMSCGCPIISTPIPHAKEILTKETGIIIDFRNSQQLADAVIRLLNNDSLRRTMSTGILQKTVSTAWGNSAIAHALLFEKISGEKLTVHYNLPDINLNHLKNMTTHAGIIQFSKINQPDIISGYTLDDNARALIAMCMYYKSTNDKKGLKYIRKYLGFIKHCQQAEGNFLNYADRENHFTGQNKDVDLDDSNGRAVWALGYVVSLIGLLPAQIIAEADIIIEKYFCRIEAVHSTRAMAFSIKGLYYYHNTIRSPENLVVVKTFANHLVQMFNHKSGKKWEWFEGYLTYANSALPEAMLYAWLLTGNAVYKEIAVSSFNFLLSKLFSKNGLEVTSNKKWLKKKHDLGRFGEQPVDVACTIMTLSKFYDVFKNEDYHLKMETAFQWFLGRNRLHQIVYNPCTSGCYDGLEESDVNLNQGAESTVSYLLARLSIEKHVNSYHSDAAPFQKPVRMDSTPGKTVYTNDCKNQTEHQVPVLYPPNFN